MKSIELALSAYGPFDELKLNITLITILAGPNIIGKSFLMRAIYRGFATILLAVSPPVSTES
ncbi:MAG: AAA family ATPase [Desulfurococcaceae archaeon]|nr:AAA family ATPase [Desulfurococcaceae archaeon]